MKLSYKWLKEFVEIKLPINGFIKLLNKTGIGVAGYEKLLGDVVFDLEITPNRGDLLSVVGVARAVASLSGVRVKLPRFKLYESGEKTDKLIKIEVHDKDSCPRYMCRIVNNVKVGKSKDYIVRLLEKAGINSINNIVDITNLVMLELGQPLHAFDFSKIEGGVIKIRKASKDEKIITLDGVEKKLNKNVLVIADKNKPIACAGVVGSVNSGISEETNSILIECAYFNPVVIRKSSKVLGITTESSYRFERGTDYDVLNYALDRAAYLISYESGGNVSRGIVGTTTKKLSKTAIYVDESFTRKLLGVNISKNKIRNSLKKLNYKVLKCEKLKVIPPSYRSDVSSQADVIEDIAQVYGYDNIPSSIPLVYPRKIESNKQEAITQKVRNFLSGIGFYEVINYGLCPRKLVESVFSDSIQQKVISVLNPLRKDWEVLRPSMSFDLVKTIARNVNYGNKNIAVFEIGSVFNMPNLTTKALGIAVSGLRQEKEWNASEMTYDIFDIKGIVLKLLEIFSVNFKISYSADSFDFIVAGDVICKAMKISKKILGFYELKQNVYFAEINLDRLQKFVVVDKQMKSIQRFPLIKRDISIDIKNNENLENIINIIRKNSEGLLKDIKLFDIYKKENRFSFSMKFMASDRTLTDKEINVVMEKIIHSLEEKAGIEVRKA